MARLVWTSRARRELRHIRRYISQGSPQQATRFVERVGAAVEHLTLFPHSGRIVPEDEDGEYREIFVQHYRIMYRAVGDDVEIAAIIHGARRLTEMPDPQE